MKSVFLAFWLSGFAFAAAVPATAAAPRSTVPFEFKGIVAGVPVDEATLQPCRPGPESKEDELFYTIHPDLRPQPDSASVTCTEIGSSLAGAPTISQMTLFYDGRLSSVEIMFDPAAFAKITEAFTHKYGSPCRSGVKRLETLAGGHVDSASYVWCFASGELTADMYYPDLSTSTAEYRDKNQPPPTKPKIDF